MNFKKFTAGTRVYGTNDDLNGFSDKQLDQDLLEIENYQELKTVIMFLAVCHTIIIDHNTGNYNASSPDELALVNAAKKFGFEFKG